MPIGWNWLYLWYPWFIMIGLVLMVMAFKLLKINLLEIHSTNSKNINARMHSRFIDSWSTNTARRQSKTSLQFQFFASFFINLSPRQMLTSFWKIKMLEKILLKIYRNKRKMSIRLKEKNGKKLDCRNYKRLILWYHGQNSEQKLSET